MIQLPQNLPCNMSVPSIQVTGGEKTTVFRHILPRAHQDRPQDSPAASKVTAKRKKPTMGACEACRKRKCKCDGLRPACLRCVAGQQECVYLSEPWETPASNLRRKFSELQTEVRRLHESNAALNILFQALRSREDQEAGAILQRIREGNDVESIINSMSAGDLLLHLQVCPKSSRGLGIESLMD